MFLLPSSVVSGRQFESSTTVVCSTRSGRRHRLRIQFSLQPDRDQSKLRYTERKHESDAIWTGIRFGVASHALVSADAGSERLHGGRNLLDSGVEQLPESTGQHVQSAAFARLHHTAIASQNVRPFSCDSACQFHVRRSQVHFYDSIIETNSFIVWPVHLRVTCSLNLRSASGRSGSLGRLTVPPPVAGLASQSASACVSQMQLSALELSGIYGWRKRCLYFLLSLLCVLSVFNLAALLWISSLLQLNPVRISLFVFCECNCN